MKFSVNVDHGPGENSFDLGNVPDSGGSLSIDHNTT